MQAGGKRVLVSGGAGFAGRHLVSYVAESGAEVIAPSRGELDMTDAEAVRAAVREAQPQAVMHLAALSSPSQSWDRPLETVLANVRMTGNLLEAVRDEAPAASVALVSSAQVYGLPDRVPVSEAAALSPENPYAVSKASSELLGRQYADAYGLDVTVLRPFNHAGPGQDEQYVIASIAKQIAEAELAGGASCVLQTGNPHASRDFTDVRDVVRAYVLATGLGGGTFNVCSGRAASVSRIVEIASSQAHLEVRHEVDPALVRAHEPASLYGSSELIRAECGWEPEIPLRQTVGDMLEWWRDRLGARSRRQMQ